MKELGVEPVPEPEPKSVEGVFDQMPVPFFLPVSPDTIDFRDFLGFNPATFNFRGLNMQNFKINKITLN